MLAFGSSKSLLAMLIFRASILGLFWVENLVRTKFRGLRIADQRCIAHEIRNIAVHVSSGMVDVLALFYSDEVGYLGHMGCRSNAGSRQAQTLIRAAVPSRTFPWS